MKIYISFGQVHTHRVNNQTFDCDCLAEIECDSHEHGRNLAFEFFDDKFFTSYEEKDLDLEWFSRGIIRVN